MLFNEEADTCCIHTLVIVPGLVYINISPCSLHQVYVDLVSLVLVHVQFLVHSPLYLPTVPVVCGSSELAVWSPILVHASREIRKLNHQTKIYMQH